MSTKGFNANGHLTFYDSSTHERTMPFAPVTYYDDFLGDAIDAKWTLLDTSGAGDTTPLLGADIANGTVQMPLDTDDEV